MRQVELLVRRVRPVPLWFQEPVSPPVWGEPPVLLPAAQLSVVRLVSPPASVERLAPHVLPVQLVLRQPVSRLERVSPPVLHGLPGSLPDAHSGEPLHSALAAHLHVPEPPASPVPLLPVSLPVDPLHWARWDDLLHELPFLRRAPRARERGRR